MCGIYIEAFKSKEKINFSRCLNILDGLKKGPRLVFL